MRKQKFTAIVAGGILAAVAAASLSACTSPAEAAENENLLVIDTLTELDCESNVTVDELQETAVYVDDANAMEAKGILALNEGLDDLEPLTQALDDAIELLSSCSDPEPSASASPTPSETAECNAMFVQVELERSKNEVDPRYGPAVRPILKDDSLSDEEKYEAITVVELELAASNAQTLTQWAQAAGVYDDANDWPELVDGGKIVDGACLNEEGRMLYAKYEGAVTAEGVDMEIGEAPANGTNTGIHGDTAVVADEPGIRGDRTAVIRTFKDGSKLIQMIRCGNIVYIIVPPNLPPGETDNPPKPKPPEPPELEPKKPSDDPYPRGNAPVGGGPNKDPGPGEYKAPEDMEQPPSTPRENPAPPPPEPPASSDDSGPRPAPAPTKDSAPPPAPEPEAPKPSEPETGCIAIPGVEDCS